LTGPVDEDFPDNGHRCIDLSADLEPHAHLVSSSLTGLAVVNR
jgi:hypothetical protein